MSYRLRKKNNKRLVIGWLVMQQVLPDVTVTLQVVSRLVIVIYGSFIVTYLLS